MTEEIYVVGHMNPDTDAVCSAIAYAEFKKKAGFKGEYTAARIGGLNPETVYVLDRFGFKEPLLLTDGAGKKLILVDHNEESQSVKGYSEADIVEVLDHHKINFKCSKPIFYLNEPVGSTATLIADKFLSGALELDDGVAGILLSAILSDTVVFKSATTTEKDREIAYKLAEIAGIDDVTGFGIAVKKAKSSLSGLTESDIIHSDYKDFVFGGSKVGIGQIEIVDRGESDERRRELIDELKRIQVGEGYALVVLMITDIIEEGSELLVAGMADKVGAAFGGRVLDNSIYLKGVMSRKKEIVPQLEGIF